MQELSIWFLALQQKLVCLSTHLYIYFYLLVFHSRKNTINGQYVIQGVHDKESGHYKHKASDSLCYISTWDSIKLHLIISTYDMSELVLLTMNKSLN